MNFSQDLSKLKRSDLETMLIEANNAQKRIMNNPDEPIKVVSVYRLGEGELCRVETNMNSAFVLQELERIEATIINAIKKRFQ